jgi:hypothetical protein
MIHSVMFIFRITHTTLHVDSLIFVGDDRRLLTSLMDGRTVTKHDMPRGEVETFEYVPCSPGPVNARRASLHREIHRNVVFGGSNINSHHLSFLQLAVDPIDFFTTTFSRLFPSGAIRIN